MTFRTSDGGIVSGHRAIVAAGSPVFHAMLYGNMRESTDEKIELPTVSTKSLQHVLEFVYTGQVEATLSEYQSLLLAAHYFNISALETKCVETITDSLDELNCCKLIIFAMQEQLDKLLKQCYVYMHDKICKVINAPDFKSLPVEVVTEICSNSDLCVKELDLFFAINKWSDYHKSTLSEDTIKSVLHLIRYPLIYPRDLVEKVGPSNRADPFLYKAALEYHVWPNNFHGPEDQIKIRKYYFDFPTTSKELLIQHNSKGTFITNVSESVESSGICYCFAKVHLTESSPVQFKLYLRSCSGQIKVFAGIYAPKSRVARLCVDHFPLNKELDGCIALKEQNLQIKIGNDSATIAFKDYLEDDISLGVYLKNKGSKVQIIKI